jgi:hypothetical protein
LNHRSSSLTLERRVARILRQALEQGASVEIDGLGTFLPGRKQGFRFLAQTEPQVFIAYVQEDLRAVRKLCRVFEEHGFDPWLDKEKLMPGQNWPRAIETAIHTSDFVVACFSHRSVSKRGSFHAELRFALSAATQVPLDEVFLIPLRLDACVVPPKITKQTQYVNLFPNWARGCRKMLAVMNAQLENRRKKRLPLAG